MPAQVIRLDEWLQEHFGPEEDELRLIRALDGPAIDNPAYYACERHVSFRSDDEPGIIFPGHCPLMHGCSVALDSCRYEGKRALIMLIALRQPICLCHHGVMGATYHYINLFYDPAGRPEGWSVLKARAP